MRVHLYPMLSVETYNQFLGRKSPTIQQKTLIVTEMNLQIVRAFCIKGQKDFTTNVQGSATAGGW